MERSSGILLPIFSLPGKYGIGCLGKNAYDFVDFLKEAGQKYWQILPLGPTSYGDSPYQSFSTFAGNPYFIDLETLIERGLLEADKCNRIFFGNDETDIDYGQIYEVRFSVLREAFEKSDHRSLPEFQAFLKENEDWVEDYALYMAVKNSFNDVSITEWDDDIRLRKADALEKYEKMLEEDKDFYIWLQYEFFMELKALKKYANENGIRIIGDMPIYVSLDSADVWANPDLFELDKDMNPTEVAGCPPDGFSATGQLWGNPLYKWKRHKETGYKWWIRRMKKCSELYDVVRIDHFRCFDEFYAIPAGDDTAENGKWKKGPGKDVFDAIKAAVPDLDIIAEDLGYMTDTVRKLVKDTGYPNMKVLEFAFDSRDSSGANDYLPHNYERNCVVYTGTHDNETLLGWLSSITPEELKMVADYVDGETMDKEDLVRRLVRAAHGSVATTCIIPIQDYLILDNSARINMPSTLGKNWRWRMTKEQASKALAHRIFDLTRLFGR